MKTIHLNYLLSLLSLFLTFGCVADKQQTIGERQTNTENRTAGNVTRTEICQNCHVNFKTSLLAQKMAINSHTHGLCNKCSREYKKQHQ